MTLSDFATFSTAVSGIAVTASLVYLAMQTYQNGKHTKAQLQQSQAERVMTTLMSMANSDLASAWITGNGGAATPEAVKALQFAQLCNAFMYDMMAMYNQHADGLMTDEMFGASVVAYRTFLQQPGLRAFWMTWRDARQKEMPKFIAWVDALAAAPAAGSNPNWL